MAGKVELQSRSRNPRGASESGAGPRDTTVVAYTTDIPAFGGAWGEPFLVGPGTIHVAHTLEERVPKKQLLEAVDNLSKEW